MPLDLRPVRALQGERSGVDHVLRASATYRAATGGSPSIRPAPPPAKNRTGGQGCSRPRRWQNLRLVLHRPAQVADRAGDEHAGHWPINMLLTFRLPPDRRPQKCARQLGSIVESSRASVGARRADSLVRPSVTRRRGRGVDAHRLPGRVAQLMEGAGIACPAHPQLVVDVRGSVAQQVYGTSSAGTGAPARSFQGLIVESSSGRRRRRRRSPVQLAAEEVPVVRQPGRWGPAGTWKQVASTGVRRRPARARRSSLNLTLPGCRRVDRRVGQVRRRT